MAIEAKWHTTGRPSLERLGAMVLVANWRTVEPECPANEDDGVFWELYFDYASGEHFRVREGWDKGAKRVSIQWDAMAGGSLTVTPPKWATSRKG